MILKKNNPQVYERIEITKKEIEFIKTGFPVFDSLLDGGFLKKEMVVLGGNSGTGKSYIAGEIFYNAAKQGFNSAYFSLEISSQMVLSRIIGSVADIKPIQILTGRVSSQDENRQSETKAKIWVNNAWMWYYDTIYRMDEIEKEIKINAFEFVVVDFIQNIVSHERDEYVRLSSAAIQIQRIAKQCNCCILVLSQLSLDKGSRIDREDELLAYKGSGSIATACDLGLIIVRDRDAMGFQQDKFKIVIKKNRRGISGQHSTFSFSHPGGKIREEAI